MSLNGTLACCLNVSNGGSGGVSFPEADVTALILHRYFSFIATIGAILCVATYYAWHAHRKIVFQDWLCNYKLRNVASTTSSKLRIALSECTQRPPQVKGHLFWGSAIEFSQNAAEFLQKVGKEYGPVATIRLISRRVVYLTDIHSFSNFCHEPKFDFRPVINQVNGNVFGFTVQPGAVDEHRKRLVYFYRSVKVADTIKLFDDHLDRTMNDIDWRGNDAKLHDFVIETGFLAIFRTLLGTNRSNLEKPSGGSNSQKEDVAKFYLHYSKFVKYFNHLWLGLPLKMFPEASQAFKTMIDMHPTVEEIAGRADVCPYLVMACKLMISNGNATEDILHHSIELLHVHANILRLAYWITVHTLNDSVAKSALISEIEEIVEQKKALYRSNNEETDARPTLLFEIDEIENIQSLGSIFKETLRLVSGVVVIRCVTQDTVFKVEDGPGFLLKRGETIFFYPPAHHRDPEIYNTPDRFIWDRFLNTTFTKNGKVIEKPLLGFGSLCVGQRFAAILAKWYVIQLFYRWQMQLTGPVPKVNEAYQGHEVLPPIEDTTFSYEPRVGTWSLRINTQLS